MPPRTRPSPRDSTGAKRAKLADEHAKEQEQRSQELGMATQAAAQREASDEITDLTGDPGGVVSGFGVGAAENAEEFRAHEAQHLPMGATKQPGQPGVSIDNNGIMTDTGQPGWSRKTNSTAVTGTGTETPSAVPGGTIADQQVRGTVDTVNAANVGAPGGPDPEAPRVWLLGDPGTPRDPENTLPVRGQPVHRQFPPEVQEYAGDVAVVDQRPAKVIRVNDTIEHMTFGVGTDYNFAEGQRYKVPAALADHLEELGYVWH